MKTELSYTENITEFDVVGFQGALEAVKAEVQRLGSRVESMVEGIEKLQESLNNVTISEARPSHENSMPDQREAEVALHDARCNSKIAKEAELQSEEQAVLHRAMDKLENLMMAAQGSSLKDVALMNKYVRSKLAQLRFDCFRSLGSAMNGPSFEEHRIRWEIPVQADHWTGKSKRVQPYLQSPPGITPSFINIISTADLGELSNGHLGETELEWLRDDRIRFAQGVSFRMNCDNYESSYEFLAEMLLQERYANQRRKVRSIFKYVTGNEIEEMDRNAWLFES